MLLRRALARASLVWFDRTRVRVAARIKQRLCTSLFSRLVSWRFEHSFFEFFSRYKSGEWCGSGGWHASVFLCCVVGTCETFLLVII